MNERAAPGTYSVADVGRALGLCDRTIRRLIDQGRIPGCFKIGRSVRFHSDQIDAWVRDGCPAPRGR
jgi:excisionase family DNA binding protein